MDLNYYLDYKDGKLFWKVSTSNRVKVGQEAGNKRKDGYKEIKVNNKRYLNHRIIWKMHYGDILEGKQIDHINGNRSDNRIENLRLVTNGQNQLNSVLKSSNKLGIKGVYKSSKNKWAIWRGNIRSYANDFFDACCVRKSWESNNEYCKKHY
jgi:hypothetical protein